MTSESEIREQVESDFGSLEGSLKVTNPGILDVIEVYGNYEAAVREANSYLLSLAPRPVFFTTDSSGWQIEARLGL
jgi:hypothetical protein